MRVIMPAIIDQAGRPFNVDEADGVNRRHRCPAGHAALEAMAEAPIADDAEALDSAHSARW